MTDHTTHFDDCGCKTARLEAELALWHAVDDVTTEGDHDLWLERLIAARAARAANARPPAARTGPPDHPP